MVNSNLQLVFVPCLPSPVPYKNNIKKISNEPPQKNTSSR